MKNIRVFISSPGDVKQERFIAKKVIQDLASDFADYANVKALLWEDMPLEATASFQEGINKIVNEQLVDIAVFILWSKLGSPLGHIFKKADGSDYQSGTEYEYDMMFQSYKQSGNPSILAYFKNAPFSEAIVSLRTETEIREAIRQNENVKDFIKTNFKDSESGISYANYKFDGPETFETQLRTHLTELIKRKIGQDVEIASWKGNPYMGLSAFSYDSRSIFCGRRRAINEISKSVISSLDKGKKSSLIILGESGSGKSSLVYAGLVPFICEGYGKRKDYFRIIQTTPSQFGGKIHEGIVEKLLNSERNGNDNYSEPIFVFDQFEEFFTDPLINEEERNKTLELLSDLVKSHKMWIIFCMRNDFYNRFAQYSMFGKIKDESILYDIPSMSVAEISSIIEEPAKKAGLKWEIKNSGVGLSKIIIDDAVRLKVLPLIEFGLFELYHHRTDDNILTFKAYQEIGGLDGAIIDYVDRFFISLTEAERAMFFEIISSVVTISKDNQTSFVRKTALLSDIAKTPEHKALLKKLIDNHILVSDKDASGSPTVTIIHEILITQWQAVKNWVLQEAEFIEDNNYYENRSQRWLDSNKAKNELIADKESLVKAEYFLLVWKKYASHSALSFLTQSIKTANRNGYIKESILFAVIMAVVSPFLLNFKSQGWYCILCLIGFFFHHLAIKLLGRPKYETAKGSLIYYAVFFVVSVLGLVLQNNQPSTELTINLQSFIPIAVLFKFIITSIEYARRRLWQKRIFDFSGRYATIVNRVKKWSVLVASLLLVLFTIIIWVVGMSNLSKKEEHLSSMIEDHFDSFDKNRYSFSQEDYYKINLDKKDFLIEYFSDQIEDSNDPKYALQYANCLYNLAEPDLALDELKDRDDIYSKLMKLKCYMVNGNLEAAEKIAEDYSENYFITDSKEMSFLEIIWAMEMLGRFDLALHEYEKMDANQFSWDSPEYAILRGNIELANGNKRGALYYFDYVIEFDSSYKENIAQDLFALKWFGGLDDKIYDAFIKEEGYSKITAYTTKADVGITNYYKSQLIGRWYREYDSKIQSFTINPGQNICQNAIFKKNLDQESITLRSENTLLSTCNYYRFHQGKNVVYFEEFNYDIGVVSLSFIEDCRNDTLFLRQVDPSKPDSIGQPYYMFKSEF